MRHSFYVLLFIIFQLPHAFALEDIHFFERDDAKFKAVLFLSQECPCSQSHVEHLNQLKDQFSQVSFYGVISDLLDPKNEREVLTYFDSKQFQFPILLDREQKLVKRYGALKTPHVVLLRQVEGGEKYETLYEGGVSDGKDFSQSEKKYLEENLVMLAQEKPVKYRHGKSMGCYIRRL